MTDIYLSVFWALASSTRRCAGKLRVDTRAQHVPFWQRGGRLRAHAVAVALAS